MNTTESQFLKPVQDEQTFPDKHDSDLIECFEAFSAVTTGGLYVLNIPQMQFCCIKPDDFFLCGFSVGEALKLGNSFYSKIVYPEDLPLWKNMLKSVLHYLKDSDDKRNEVDFFSCTFRLQHTFNNRPLAYMVYHRMKPVWEDGKLHYLICSVVNSTVKEAGNLLMHNIDGLTYEECNLKNKKWKRITIKMLTERERAILMLAGQGKKTKEIANDLYRGHNTIHNQKQLLFPQLNVHSKQEAIEYAHSHRMIYYKDIQQHFFPNGHDSALIKYFEVFSSITTGWLYILNIPQIQFGRIKPDDFFPCRSFVGEALNPEDKFYREIIYSGDLSLCENIIKAVLNYLKNSKDKQDMIDFFSCTFHLQYKYSFHPDPLTHLVYFRMKPVKENDELRYLICSAESSTAKESGNLYMHNIDGFTYEECNLKNEQWERKTIKPLTELERAILMYAWQGKTIMKIANILQKKYSIIRYRIKTLFSKFNVHSIQEAIEYASRRCMIFPKVDGQHHVIAPRKRTRATEDILHRVQQYLYDGKSIRGTAKMTGTTESAIRNWMSKGMLKRYS
jgi:DNA-binding NarL/FixJ family response regulator